MTDHEAASADRLTGAAIRAAREERNCTQKQLAAHLAARGWRIDPTALTRIESGERSIRVSQLVLIADALGVSARTLLRDDSIATLAQQSLDAYERVVDSMVDWFASKARLMWAQDEARGRIAAGDRPIVATAMEMGLAGGVTRAAMEAQRRVTFGNATIRDVFEKEFEKLFGRKYVGLGDRVTEAVDDGRHQEAP